MFFDDTYSHIPLQPKRKAAPTPVVYRGQIDKAWAEEQARVEKEGHDRKTLTREVMIALQANELRVAEFEKRLPGLTILFYALALQPKAGHILKQLALAFVTERHGVTVEEIASDRKFETFVRARRDAVGMVYTARPTIGLAQLGRLFGVHHTTVLHMLRMLGIHERLKPVNPEWGKQQNARAQAREKALLEREALGYTRLGPMPILTPAIVLEMRRLHAEGVQPTDIARRFNINPKTVWPAIRRRTWRHLP